LAFPLFDHSHHPLCALSWSLLTAVVVVGMSPSSSSTSRTSTSSSSLSWRPTKIMHLHDLSKDDDFLSHLLVEKVGTGGVPLLVHKMDPSRKVPKTDAKDVMRIVRRVSRVTSCMLPF